MEKQIKPSKVITEETEYPFQFTICTLVTDHLEYDEMKTSCIAAGFGEDDCEYLIIDNSSENSIDAYKGLNLFLQKAQGKYIIICHQDILMHDDKRSVLDNCIIELNSRDPKWGIIGNAGRVNMKYMASNLTRGTTGETIIEKDAPIRVMTVDENFILVKNEANLTLSADLKGFHMYGADLCLIADILGFHSYVVKFNLTHKSDGNLDNTFKKARKDFVLKYSKVLRSRFMASTAARFYIGPKKLKRNLFNTSFFLFFIRQYDKFFKGKRSRFN